MEERPKRASLSASTSDLPEEVESAVKYVVCLACGESGGTMEKAGGGKYRHRSCELAKLQRAESGPYSVSRGRRRLIVLGIRRVRRKGARDGQGARVPGTEAG